MVEATLKRQVRQCDSSLHWIDLVSPDTSEMCSDKLKAAQLEGRLGRNTQLRGTRQIRSVRPVLQVEQMITRECEMLSGGATCDRLEL